MSNTKDTPIDYKQFEGATPGPWQVRTEKEFIKPKTFEIINHQGLVIASVNIGMFDVEQNSRLLAAAPDLLKENQSLKLELQKQKELCKATIALLDNIMSDMKEEGGNQWYTDQIEELIKQSEPLIYKPNEI